MKTLILLGIALTCGTGIMAWAAWQERRKEPDSCR